MTAENVKRLHADEEKHLQLAGEIGATFRSTEGNPNLHRTVHRIKSLAKRAGAAINPATPAAVLEEILPDVDQALVMTVDLGVGHQSSRGRAEFSAVSSWGWTGASMRKLAARR